MIGLPDAPVRFWICPIEHPREPLREQVRWVDGKAYCLEPGCGRSSGCNCDACRTARIFSGHLIGLP